MTALLQISEPGQRGKDKCAGRAIGIDLGTTNSLVATVRDASPVCLVDDEGRALLPSVVHYEASGDTVVGQEAEELAAAHPRDTIVSVKRFVGRGPKDVEALRTRSPYCFVDDPSGRMIRFQVAGDRAVTPIEVSAEILFRLRMRAEEQLGGPIDGAVITVPAYFDDAQRQATKDAARLAGLEVLRLLNEPTAAALAYGLDRKKQGTFAVYDLGGGTFDISILKLEDGVFEVKATAGDTALGGDDFDRAVVDRLVGADAYLEPAALRTLLSAVRAARERLTTESVVALEGRELARAELDAIIAPVIQRTAGACRRALKDAGLAPDDLDGVVLVGGATRTPAVRRFVADLFRSEPLCDLDPDRVVALGAAVQADVLAGSGANADVLLLDVIPLSLGLEMMGGVVEKLIHRNTTIPAGAKQTFTTFADRQTGFDLHVVQGERELASQCRSLARFQLKGIPPLPAGMARAEILFVVDADGLLHVTAREETTGVEAHVGVKPSYGLTDDEVERMLLDSYAHADEDVMLRLLTEQRVEAERIVTATRVALSETPELLEGDDLERIEAAMVELARLASGSDHNAIKVGIEALDGTSKEFASRRMNRAIDRAMVGKRVGDVASRVGEGRTGGHG